MTVNDTANGDEAAGTVAASPHGLATVKSTALIKCRLGESRIRPWLYQRVQNATLWKQDVLAS